MESVASSSMARRMINAAICAYQVHPKDWKPGPGTHPPVTRRIQGPGGAYFYDVVAAYQDQVGFVGSAASGYAPLFASSGTSEIDAGLVGAMSDGNLLVSLRGTIPPTFNNNDIIAWIRDWLQDADILPRLWAVSRGPVVSGLQVETGFAGAMISLWPQLARMIDQTLAANTCTGVVITGHSKGAAMTFLAATLIEAAYPQFKGKIEVHAFAPPAAGNALFQTFYGGTLGSATHRYQVENDIVPFLPLWVDADIFGGISFTDKAMEAVWIALFVAVAYATGGGYEAVGDFTYFDDRHRLVPGTNVLTSALPAVAAAMEAGDFAKVAAAHSAVASYLPCFP